MKHKHFILPLTLTLGASLWQTDAFRPLASQAMGSLIQAVNQQRKKTSKLDYVLLELPAIMPTSPIEMNLIERRIFGDPPISIIEVQQAFERIAHDERVQGVILKLSSLALSLADLQTLRDTILRLRGKGKRVICHAYRYDTATYYLASAADEIILQPGGELMTLGLNTQITFMRDALEAIGVEVDAIAISPYKSAADTFTEQEPSPEVKNQINWILDSQYQQILQSISTGRGMTTEAVHTLIDNAPHTEQSALAEGYIDAIYHEETLPDYLSSAHIIPWENAQHSLPILWHGLPKRYVAVVPLSGIIVDGESQKPPRDVPVPIVGAERIGSKTLAQQVRSLLKDKHIAAVVLWIDSRGGSATASEAMSAALDELSADRPLVVAMNGVAASGGYYIATPAQWIVAQPGTITGSIGVIMAKAINSDMLKKLRFNSVPFQRGKNADLLSTTAPFSEDQREKMRASIEHVYDQFLGRVAHARQMSREAVDEIGGGRVWTGQQALENGLVDQLGGLREAIQKARELAGLAEDTPAFFVTPPRKPIGPQLRESLNPAAGLHYTLTGINGILNGHAQFLLPYDIKLEH